MKSEKLLVQSHTISEKFIHKSEKFAPPPRRKSEKFRMKSEKLECPRRESEKFKPKVRTEIYFLYFCISEKFAR